MNCTICKLDLTHISDPYYFNTVNKKYYCKRCYKKYLLIEKYPITYALRLCGITFKEAAWGFYDLLRRK